MSAGVAPPAARAARGVGVALVLAGCTGSTLDGGTSMDAPVAVDVAGRCAAAHGTAETPLTAAAVAAALAGRWLVCGYDASSSSALLAHDGIDFTAAGEWSLLKSDGAFGYEHTVNDGTFGTYALVLDGTKRVVPPTDATPFATGTTPFTGVTLQLKAAALDLRIAFEVSPKRLLTRGPSEVDFVRLDEGVDEPMPYTSKEGERCGSAVACRVGLACRELRAEGDAGLASVCAPAP